MFPENYREWVYLSTGIDMNYRPDAGMGHSMFDNVFVNPEAYKAFQATGTWPDKTMLVLEVRGAGSKKNSDRQELGIDREGLTWSAFGLGGAQGGDKPAGEAVTSSPAKAARERHPVYVGFLFLIGKCRMRGNCPALRQPEPCS